MALKSGRVGVRPDQVDVHGRLIPTDWLIGELRDLLDVESAELHALNTARLERLKDQIIDKPVITPVEDPNFRTEIEEDDNGSEVE